MSLDRKPTTAAFYALRDVIKEIREDWSLQGIEVAMRKAQERPATFTFGEMARAFVTIALDPSTRTPALLAFDGDHWFRGVKSRRQQETDDFWARAVERAQARDEAAGLASEAQVGTGPRLIEIGPA